MDVIGAQADDEEQDFIRNVCEKETLSGENLLGMFAPLIIDICNSPNKYPDPKVETFENCVSLLQILIFLRTVGRKGEYQIRGWEYSSGRPFLSLPLLNYFTAICFLVKT